jgi:hypothetical protein
VPRIDHEGWENYNSEIKFEEDGNFSLKDIASGSFINTSLASRRSAIKE